MKNNNKKGNNVTLWCWLDISPSPTYDESYAFYGIPFFLVKAQEDASISPIFSNIYFPILYNNPPRQILNSRQMP